MTKEPGTAAIAAFDPDALRELGRLDWIAQAIVEGISQGLHRSRAKGFSAEFSEFKPYARGDDLRFLDWRVYGRTGKYYVRRYEAETSMDCLLLLDATRSMAWRWKTSTTKLEYSVVLMAALTCLMVNQQDQVGLLAHDGVSSHHVPPSGRRTQTAKILSSLEHLEPGSQSALASLIRDVPKTRHRKGQIIVCSDLEEEGDALLEVMPQLRHRGDEVLLLHVLDRAEVELPYPDSVTHLQDSESGRRVRVNMPQLKAAHARRVGEFRAQWSAACQQHQIRYVPLDTSVNYLDAVMTIAVSRTDTSPG